MKGASMKTTTYKYPENKEMNLKVAARNYYNVTEDVHVDNREFEVGNSHVKVEQVHDMKPGKVKHIDPADYDGPQRSMRLEATHKANKQQLKREYLAEADGILESYEAWYDSLDGEFEDKPPEYDEDGVFIGDMDSQNIAYQE